MLTNYFPAYSFAIILFVFVLVVCFVWFLASKKSLKKKIVLIEEILTDIDLEMRHRYDLIPEIVEIAQGYASHERDIYKNLFEARLKALVETSIGKRVQTEKILSSSVRYFFVTTDNYPQFKTNDRFLEIQKDLISAEEKLGDHVRGYNERVNIFNAKIYSYPAKFTAYVLGVKERELFEVWEE